MGHFELKHPLILDKLTKMRNQETSSYIFRTNLFEITQLIAYEATKNFPLIDEPIITPVAPMVGQKLENKVVILPILRAGLGMSDALVQLIPTASVGHIGLYRNEETLKPTQYYCKIPSNISECDVIVCDPMIATANSVITVLDMICQLKPKSIRVIGLVAAPEGLTALKEKHPNIDVYVAAIDEKLNENGYIVPGLGDAGDRIFKTK